MGYESRQVVDIEISRIVTEYRAQILEDTTGMRYTAPFPEGINRPVQYGLNVKVHSVYMSQYQLVPYKRIEEDFQDQVKIPISAGTVFNFNYDAYHKLEAFEAMVKSKLIESGLCHADETGININGKRAWLHCVSNDLWSYYLPHEKRGLEAMEEMGVLPHFKGILCRDHWNLQNPGNIDKNTGTCWTRPRKNVHHRMKARRQTNGVEQNDPKLETSLND